MGARGCFVLVFCEEGQHPVVVQCATTSPVTQRPRLFAYLASNHPRCFNCLQKFAQHMTKRKRQRRRKLQRRRMLAVSSTKTHQWVTTCRGQKRGSHGKFASKKAP